MYSQSQAFEILQKYNPTDTNEQNAKTFMAEFVMANPRYWARSTQAGHLTASAWITDVHRRKAVLLHHKKLDIWVQPGGHIDDDDETLLAAGLREAQEETGLRSLTPVLCDVFDLDVHAIPARKSEPAHLHLDVRFWFMARDTQLLISEESNELTWMTADEISGKTKEESILRMMRKTLT